MWDGICTSFIHKLIFVCSQPNKKISKTYVVCYDCAVAKSNSSLTH